MIRFFLCLLLFVAAALAQPATTQVVGPVYDQFGNPYSGSVNISLSTKGSSVGSNAIVSLVTKKNISNGVLSVNLAPNDTMTPSGTVYLFAFANGDQRVCTIPTSVSPVSLANPSICVEGGAPAAGATVPISWLNGGSLSPGTYCIVVGSNGQITLTQTGCPGSGSSGGGLTLSALTNSQLLSLTNSQLLSLSN